MHTRRDVVIFDFGGVLIDWNPRYLYRKLFGDDEAAMEAFLAEVTTPEWNLQQDAGRSWDEAVRVLTAEHPTKADLIAEILRDYERHGDAMRYLNAEGKIAWKTSPRPCFGNWSTRSASLRMIGGFFGPQIRSEQFG